MKKAIIALALLGILSSCGNKSDEQIEQEIASGVVLVQSRSYYEVILSKGGPIYFSSYDDINGVQGIAFDEDSIEASTSYGTGFFISKNGEIATNAHLVSNMASPSDANISMTSLFASLKESFYALYNESNAKYENAVIHYNYANTNDEVSYEDFYEIRNIRDSLKKERDEYADYYRELDEIRASDSEIKYHNELSVVCNGTNATDTRGFISCVVTKTDAEHDLAIIQVKDKKTPEGKYVFAVEEEDPLEEYTWKEEITKLVSEDKNSSLIMTSFNLDPNLALTTVGIKPQFSKGSISQKANDTIKYSIPSLPGSSGSPVVNLRGQLVAMNLVEPNGTQNHNYGLRIKHLWNLITNNK